MIVVKLGGSCLTKKEYIDSIADLLSTRYTYPLLVVVSAMGKTTRDLEEVVAAYYDAQDAERARSLLKKIGEAHFAFVRNILPLPTHEKCRILIQECLEEASLVIEDTPQHTRAYYYDQIVCAGELLSSNLLHFILREQYGITAVHTDARDVIVTDDRFGQARILRDKTQHRMKHILLPRLAQSILITQGFIGATEQNQSTTLGKEGSDYSAAVFAQMLSATRCDIYKDVSGIMNADPQLQANAQTLPFVSYEQVAERAYFGASVLHPKTLYPLQQAEIPLFVRSIVSPQAPYTQVAHKASPIPAFTRKDRQCLIYLKNKTGGFVAEHLFHLSTLTDYPLPLCTFSHIDASVLTLCFSVEEAPHHLSDILNQWAKHFEIDRTDDITLLTWWHTDEEDIRNALMDISPIAYVKTDMLTRVLAATNTLPDYTHQRKT